VRVFEDVGESGAAGSSGAGRRVIRGMERVPIPKALTTAFMRAPQPPGIVPEISTVTII
jgi:hypothetical protein